MLNVYNERLLTFFIHCEKNAFLTFFILLQTFSTSMVKCDCCETPGNSRVPIEMLEILNFRNFPEVPSKNKGSFL
jgi:hypothetical protein